MNSQKRRPDSPISAHGPGPLGVGSASRRGRRANRWRRLLPVAVLCLAMTGCSVLAPWSAKKEQTSLKHPMATQKEAKERKSLFRSWFGPKEPEPPQSLREWMDLEPIRP